jgi:FAD/FMN-containing dehydrogenase
MNLDSYSSWGRYPKIKPKDAKRVFWINEFPNLEEIEGNILPYGLGKSYGDSCLNENGTLIDLSGLNKFISFNEETGLLRCEAGVTLATILDYFVPRGWFLSVTPGTKFITVGGAIGNDVHGKNHHKMGTFGCHVTQFELLRSNGTRTICSPEQNSELFSATIGGLGLTGIITWAEFYLKPCPSAFFAMESVKFGSVKEFFEINEASDKDYDYSVSWVDCSAGGNNLGRGLYTRGNHASPKDYNLPPLPKPGLIPFPFDAPFINNLSVIAFCMLYYNKQFTKKEASIVHYNPFFYPLDAVDGWNKAYGKNGFLQYQFVVPFGNDEYTVNTILREVVKSGMSSFLTVLKTFGNIKSPGMLSFPRPGITLATDFRFDGEKTLKELAKLDEIVKFAGGILYPAKDARMSGKDFFDFYPEANEFVKYIDPKFSSSFWRRVNSN